MARNITLPTAVDLSTASTDLFFTTGGATANYLPTGGWNGGNAVEFTPPNMYPPPFPDGNQGAAGLGNFILTQNPPVVNVRWLFRGSADYFSLSSRWQAEPSQKAFIMRRTNGDDGIDRVLVNFHEYDVGQFDIAICNGIDCRYPTQRFPLHQHAQGKWICFEVEANLQTGMKRLYVTTEDGAFRNFLLQEEALAAGTSTWQDIDFIGFFNGPINTAIPGFSFRLANVSVSNQFIGPPIGFGDPQRTRRYYLSRRIGTGIPGANDSFRCESYDWLRTNAPGQHNAVAGYVGPICTWTLRAYELSQTAHDAMLAALPNTYAFPDVPLTTLIRDLTPAVRNEMVAKIDAAGFDMTWVNGTTLGDVINYILQSCDLAHWANIQIGNKLFDVRRRTVGSLTAPQWSAIQDRAAAVGADLTGLAANAPLTQVVQRFRSVTLRDGNPPITEVSTA